MQVDKFSKRDFAQKHPKISESKCMNEKIKADAKQALI